MILDDEARGRGLLFVQGAARQIIDAVAQAAMEMMMVSLARALVKRPERGVVDLPQPAVFEQQLEIAVDGGLIERLDQQSPAFQYFFDAERPVPFAEHLLDGRPLRCLALHPLHLAPAA